MMDLRLFSGTKLRTKLDTTAERTIFSNVAHDDICI